MEFQIEARLTWDIRNTRCRGCLFMQYVILRVALHAVLIVITLGHVEANVKSFGKKNKNDF